ncbi:MAG: glycosyltransferase family 2 protein [Actinobacteria bacterium]|nr:glycosyltransferase family 2 protein [Actinomycetota bacterium]
MPDADLPTDASPIPGAETPLELTVVLPCLNEAETLAICIRKALGSIRDLGIAGEVVIADNGSTDGSQEIARAEGARVVDVPIKGYGAALMGGIEAARGRFVIMADADDSYDLSTLGPFVEALRAGADLVMGNRFEGGIAPGAMPPLHRYLGNPVLSLIGRLFFHSPAGDFHCGMRGFRRDAILGLGLRTTGMEFASEMVVKATLEQLVITEVPTTLSPDGRSRAPHLRTWRDGWRHLRFLLLYSPRWLFLYPGILLFTIGIVLGIALIPGPIEIGDHALDVSALIYAMVMVLVGFQAIMFGVFARSFAMNEGLLPVSKGLQRAFHVVTLERGLVIGVLALLVGLGLAIYSIVNWGSNDFGALDTRDAVRVAVPAATLLVLGVETIMASFFLSVLGLARR